MDLFSINKAVNPDDFNGDFKFKFAKDKANQNLWALTSVIVQ